MNHKSTSYKIFLFANYLFMAAVFIVCIFPYFHTLAKALNDGNDTMRGGITFYPRVFTMQNFQVLLADTSIYRAFFISVLRVVIGTVLGVAVQFAAGYALSHQNLPGRRKLMLFIIIPTFIAGGTIPTYLLYVHSGLINNFWVYILPQLMSYYNVMVIRSYIESSVPSSLNDAAAIDGAHELTIMCRIIFPLCLPVVATVSLWVAVTHWNNWTTTMYYVTKESLFTLQYKLMQVVKESERLQALLQAAQASGEDVNVSVKSTPESLVSAQVIITTIPIIIVYPFLQKYFVKGVTLGAVKS